MKMDPLILGMVKSDVAIVLEVVIRDHLGCECVDRRDPDAHAEHLAQQVVDMLETQPDTDGSYAKFAADILNRSEGA